MAEPGVLALGMVDRHISAASLAGVDPGRIQIVINRWRQNDDEILSAFEKTSRRPMHELA